MFTVFQFFNLIPTTELIGPFILPHAVCAVIVTIFVRAIFATDNTTRNIEDTIKSDHLDNVVDPPTKLGPRTLISTHRSSANSNALQQKPTNLITHFSNDHSPRSTRSRPIFPSTIHEFKALLAAVQFFSYSKIPGPQLLLPAPVKTHTLLSTAKLKAPNYSYSSILQREQLTAAAALYVLDDDFFANHAFLAAPLFHQPLPTAAAASDLDADCRSESSSPDENSGYAYSANSNDEPYEFCAHELTYL